MLLVAACSSDSKSSDTTEASATTAASGAATSAGGATTTAGGVTTTGGAATSAAGSAAPSATGGSAPATAGGAGGSTPSTISPGERTPTDPANPVQGGKMVYGLEADSANPWAPYRVSCASSCLAVLRGISDSLFGDDVNGQPVPNLVKTVSHSDDYTQWKMTLRDGIKFQDGTPLDGAAVKFNIDTCLDSPLTGAALTAIDHVEASGQDVTVFTKGGPWVAFPTYFTHGSCAYMFSPKWLGSLSDVPQRNAKAPVYDATLAATPADGDPAKPVGLGAFKYESYTPGNGNAFKAVRNPDYWRGPSGITGEKLPYLDEIDYVVVVDEDSRSNSVQSGDINIMMT